MIEFYHLTNHAMKLIKLSHVFLFLINQDKLVGGYDHGLVNLQTRVQFPVNSIKTL